MDTNLCAYETLICYMAIESGDESITTTHIITQRKIDSIVLVHALELEIQERYELDEVVILAVSHLRTFENMTADEAMKNIMAEACEAGVIEMADLGVMM